MGYGINYTLYTDTRNIVKRQDVIADDDNELPDKDLGIDVAKYYLVNRPERLSFARVRYIDKKKGCHHTGKEHLSKFVFLFF